MKHLQQRLRSGETSFVYRTAPEGNVIAVEVYYLKTDNLMRRGIYCNVQPQEIKDGCISIVLMSGVRVHCAFLARKNDKMLLAIAAKIDEHAPALAALMADDKPADVKALLHGVLYPAEVA
jgi:hypothetical protein